MKRFVFFVTAMLLFVVSVDAQTQSKPKPPSALSPTLGASDSVPNVITINANGVSFNMVEVQGGTFTMGATAEQGSDVYSGEMPTHQVTLSTYFIGQTEVPQSLWEAVMGKSVTQIDEENNWCTFEAGPNYPMYDISWNDCQEFIQKLNQLTGKTFRLPTEAEWEYAARGGVMSKGYKYAGSNDIDAVAWYYENSNGATHPVATKAPNELGIYDMSGNVWEWCQDWYWDYSSSSQTNPQGPSSGSYRVERGGSCTDDAWGCRVSIRFHDHPLSGASTLGLRLVLIP